MRRKSSIRRSTSRLRRAGLSVRGALAGTTKSSSSRETGIGGLLPCCSSCGEATPSYPKGPALSKNDPAVVITTNQVWFRGGNGAGASLAAAGLGRRFFGQPLLLLTEPRDVTIVRIFRPRAGLPFAQGR